MDGFAVRAVDTRGANASNPVELTLADESRAGLPAANTLAAGEAFRISTGGVVPEGADAVVRLEDVDEADGRITLRDAVPEGQDIRRAGEDIRMGAVVLSAGTRLGPAELGVLASQGEAQPQCAMRPSVGVICTGDELLAADEPMRPGGVRNSNAHTIPALARLAGADVVSVERCADRPDSTRDAIAGALECNVTIVCGGVSVGVHDHVKAAFAELEVEECFWGVALRPGRPTYFGTHPGGLAFGLPGNPVSAYVTFVLFVRPAIMALQGVTGDPARSEAIRAEPIARLPARDQAVRVRLELSGSGWLAHPTGPQGSHILTSMIAADALAVVAAGPGEALAGETVQVELLA